MLRSALIVLCFYLTGSSMLSENSQLQKIAFATFAETEEQLRHALYTAESLRQFGGELKNAPIFIYITPGLKIIDSEKFDRLKAAVIECDAPKEALNFYFARKVFAAADCEKRLDGNIAILVWLDEDTIILQAPKDFILDSTVSFAYRPVMHNRSGSLYSAPPDKYWDRVYTILKIDDDKLFPMETVADKQIIRAYFNAGLLVVRPEKKILRNWARSFEALYTDSALIGMCRADITKNIFLHQTALVGAVLYNLDKSELLELSSRYNYPIFFHQQFEASQEFESIEDIVTLRYDIYFRDSDPEWSKKLKGDPEIINWLKVRLDK